jgi:hypothetical protein
MTTNGLQVGEPSRSEDEKMGARAVTYENGADVAIWRPLRVPGVSDVNISSIEAVRARRSQSWHVAGMERSACTSAHKFRSSNTDAAATPSCCCRHSIPIDHTSIKAVMRLSMFRLIGFALAEIVRHWQGMFHSMAITSPGSFRYEPPTYVPTIAPTSPAPSRAPTPAPSRAGDTAAPSVLHPLAEANEQDRQVPPLSILGLPAAPPVAAAVCARVCACHAVRVIHARHAMVARAEPKLSSARGDARRHDTFSVPFLSARSMPCVRSELCHAPRRHRVVMLCAQREGIGPTIYVVGGAVAIVVLLAASIAICRRRTHASTHRA